MKVHDSPSHRLGRAAALALLLAIAAGCTPNDSVDDSILEQESRYSQSKEETIVRHFFQDERDGFFVDIGAYHWQQASTTFYLEEHLGWSGIAVDAQDALREGYEKNRKNTRFYNYFVSDKSDRKQEFFLAGPVSSSSKEHLLRFPNLAKNADAIEKTEVETITLDDLLRLNEVESVDFLSVDVEGAEPDVLAGFSIDTYKPRLVCVSAGRSAMRAQVREYFANNDYELITRYRKYDHVNLYFRPKS